MVAEMVGSNPEELEALARTMRSAGRRLDATWQDVDALLRSVPWVGSGADTFRSDWHQYRRSSLAGVAELLVRAATTLDRNAADQLQASTAAGGSGWGGPGGQGPGGQVPPPPANDLGDYTDQAYDNAGIDPDTWDPDAGVDGNRENIEAVYEYYAQLYRDHPELLWSGMAALIGPSFYAGFMDLDSFADMADFARRFLDNPPPLPPGVSVEDIFDRLFPPGVGESMRELASMSASEIEEEFRYYETTFLTMQREIFVDMAPLHEAYTSDGIDGIEALFENGEIDRDTYQAWQMIDEGHRTGDTELLQRGNEALLLREQRVVIDDDYNDMYEHGVTGPALTYLMTQVGEPSVPGAQGYADVFPWDASFDIGIGPDDIGFQTPESVFGVGVPNFGLSADNPVDGTLTVTTPFADGNIAHFDDRWALIQEDTLPAYLDLSRDEVLEVLETPVGDRADQLTTVNRIDDILHHLVTDWSIDLDQ